MSLIKKLEINSIKNPINNENENKIRSNLKAKNNDDDDARTIPNENKENYLNKKESSSMHETQQINFSNSNNC